jgi:hypothetical protein
MRRPVVVQYGSAAIDVYPLQAYSSIILGEYPDKIRRRHYRNGSGFCRAGGVEMSNSGNGVPRSRRRFLVGSAALMGVTGFAREAPSAGRSLAWSKSADVVVVGSGAAGLAAALSAASRGNQVIVIEKAPAIGGTTAKSDGAYWIPNNHIMRQAGIADPKNDAIRYMVRVSYPALYRDDDPRWGVGEREYELIEAYYDNAADAIEALESMNALLSTTVALPDYLDHVPTNKPMRQRILLPKKTDGNYGNGRELVRQLRLKLEADRIEVLTKHAASRVERNARGEVIGLTVKSADGESLMRAKKAVVFASGGFTHDPDMVLGRLCRADQPGGFRAPRHRDGRDVGQYGRCLARRVGARKRLGVPECGPRCMAAPRRQHDSSQQVRPTRRQREEKLQRADPGTF